MRYQLGDSNLQFEIWYQPESIPEIARYEIAAKFTFLQEALDYVADVTRRGATVVMLSPNYSKAKAREYAVYSPGQF